MKRIIAAIFVLAVVCGTLAFTSKKGGSYCGSFIAANTNCQIYSGRIEIPGGGSYADFWKYSAWNGTQADCLPNRCETHTILGVESK